MTHKETFDLDEQDSEHESYKEFNSNENETFSFQNSGINYSVLIKIRLFSKLCIKIVKKLKNYKDISNITLAGLRYEVSLRATAAIATAA